MLGCLGFMAQSRFKFFFFGEYSYSHWHRMDGAIKLVEWVLCVEVAELSDRNQLILG